MTGWQRQPPPGWPPPPGWSPPPGWRPDPSWPAPPEGQQWGPRAGRSRGKRLAIGILVTVLIALSGSLVVTQIADDRAGCGSVDSTDAGNYSTVTIVNDTPGTVVLDDCRNAYCHPGTLPVRLASAQRYTDDAACAVSGADMTSWRVTSDDGRVLGYIAVDTPRKSDGLTFRVSRAGRDRSTPTSPG